MSCRFCEELRKRLGMQSKAKPEPTCVRCGKVSSVSRICNDCANRLFQRNAAAWWHRR